MDIDQLYSKYLECDGQVSIDSRKIRPDAMFFAIRGERFDGNSFVDEVLAKGAKYAVVDDPSANQGEKTILVKDALKALQKLATRHRQSFDVPVLAITGSNGKTTTKELITQVLSARYEVHATNGNFNNHIGVPLTLLSATKDAELMIIEMGANHIGEIAELCHIAEPDYGLITNIGRAHLEGFGSLEGVVIGKTELYKYIRGREGILFYNPQDRRLLENLPDGVKAVPYFNDLLFKDEDLKISLKFKGDTGYRSTQLAGTYNYPNISAAVTVGQFFSVPENMLLDAICSYISDNNRSQVIHKAGITLILDAYNANPTSMKESIRSIADNTSAQDKVLLLGDMKELGSETIDLHAEVLTFIENYKWKSVILVGADFSVADKDNKYLHFEDFLALSKSKNEIVTMLRNSVCLVKASRSMKLEQIQALLE